MKKNCSQQLLHFHPIQGKINTTNYIPITKLGFPKPKYEKKRPPKQQISYLELWATPKFSPPCS